MKTLILSENRTMGAYVETVFGPEESTVNAILSPIMEGEVMIWEQTRGWDSTSFEDALAKAQVVVVVKDGPLPERIQTLVETRRRGVTIEVGRLELIGKLSVPMEFFLRTGPELCHLLVETGK